MNLADLTDPTALGSMSLPGIIGALVGSAVGAFTATRKRWQTEARTIGREEATDEVHAHVKRYHAEPVGP